MKKRFQAAKVCSSPTVTHPLVSLLGGNQGVTPTKTFFFHATHHLVNFTPNILDFKIEDRTEWGSTCRSFTRVEQPLNVNSLAQLITGQNLTNNTKAAKLDLTFYKQMINVFCGRSVFFPPTWVIVHVCRVCRGQSSTIQLLPNLHTADQPTPIWPFACFLQPLAWHILDALKMLN